MMRTASKASLAWTGRPGPHGPEGSRRPVSTTPTCSGWRGNDASSVAISSSVGLRSFGIRSTARVSDVGSTTCSIANSATSTAPRDTLRANDSSSPGNNVVASCGRSDSSGLSTCVVLRRSSSGGKPHWSNTPAGRKGVGRISTYPLSASDFPIARRRFCTGVRPRPAGPAAEPMECSPGPPVAAPPRRGRQAA